ncbi:hypothetical protein GCM10009753_76970 [Streptantibioticus ferralitis]
MGKTTLLAQARRRAAVHGCIVLWARGGEREQRVAFHVVRQLLQPLFASLSEEERARVLGSWANVVGPALGLVSPDAGLSPDHQGVIDGLDWVVTDIAVRRAPVVLIVDDAHWADSESLEWLTGFTARAEELPPLVAVAYRPDELPPVTEAFRRLAKRHGSRPYELAPLTVEAVGLLLRDKLGEGVDEAFCRECWSITEGNPFETVELAIKIL